MDKERAIKLAQEYKKVLLEKLKHKIGNLIEPVLLTEDKNNPLYADILKTGILV